MNARGLFWTEASPSPINLLQRSGERCKDRSSKSVDNLIALVSILWGGGWLFSDLSFKDMTSSINYFTQILRTSTDSKHKIQIDE